MYIIGLGSSLWYFRAFNIKKEKIRFVHPLGFVSFLLLVIFLWAIPKKDWRKAFNQYTFTW